MWLRRMSRLPALALAILAILAVLATGRAARCHAASLDIDLEGIDGELRRNVVARLAVDDRKKDGLTEAEIRDLHAGAEQAITAALQPFGYYRPFITSQLDHEGTRWKARYEINPGTPLRVDSLDVRVLGEGAADPRFEAVVAEFPLRRGDVLNHSLYELGKSRLQLVAINGGYLDARFEASEISIDLERYSAAIRVHYATGPSYRFGPVTFEQDVVDPELLKGYVKFERGDPLDFDKLIELEQTLGNSPYFSRIEVRPRRDLAVGNEVPIVVDLVPSKPGKYTFGAGYGTDNGAHTRAIAELRRLNRRGHRGEVDGSVSTTVQSLTANYSIPWPYPRTDVVTLTTGYTIENIENTEERTAFIGAGLSRLWAGWQMNYGIQFRRERFKVGLDGANSSFLVPAASWTNLVTNDPIDPTNGRRLIFSASGAHENVLSAASYLRLEGHARWLRAFGEHHRLLGRAETGHTWTSAFHDLPPSARFFAGGAQSVRGFGFHTLGPRDAAGNVTGGPVLAEISFEYEYRFLERFGVATFYDMGNAMNSYRQPLERGTGAGLRWHSPIGLVRVDLGIPLTGDRRRPEFHLAIGPAL